MLPKAAAVALLRHPATLGVEQQFCVLRSSTLFLQRTNCPSPQAVTVSRNPLAGETYHCLNPHFFALSSPQQSSARTLSSLTATHQYLYRKPSFSRNPEFKKLDSGDVKYFRSIMPNPTLQVLTSPDDISAYNIDWMHIYRGACPLVLLPSSVEQIQAVLRYCNTQKIAVVPQGGNTGLVGGSIPVFDEVVISMKNFNKVLDFDASTGILQCEAGCILESLQSHVGSAEPSYILPLDLGAKGSCLIGGNVSTNAGGLRQLRYGSLAGNVLGLEVVLPDGTIMNGMNPLKKDNTGLKLHELFIGAEGILGVITKVILVCPLKPLSVQLCMFQCDSFEKILEASIQCRRQMNDIVSAVEFFDSESLTQVLRQIPGTRDPFIKSSAFYLVIETSGQCEKSDRERVELCVETLMEKGFVTNGVWAENETQKHELWQLRETISSAMCDQGKVYKYDVTLPLHLMYTPVELVRERLSRLGLHEECETVSIGYGHLGDCNLHLNVLVKDLDRSPEIENALEPWIYEYVTEVGGSISAEHGVGISKADKIYMGKPREYIELMKRVKTLFDPNSILNPYKVFR